METSARLAHLEETVVATADYLAALTDLTDDDLRAPSLLPGWSRSHVVTHLARNADALCNLLHWAETGVPTPMYPSREQRDADIEAGAGRSAVALREDSAAAAGRFLQAVNLLDVAHEDAPVARTVDGEPFPARNVVPMRRLEVEIHHADLGLGFTHRDWSPAFAELVLGQLLTDRAAGPAMVLRATDTGGLWKYGVAGQGPDISGASRDLAWWILGRGVGTGLRSSADVLPDLGPWR